MTIKLTTAKWLLDKGQVCSLSYLLKLDFFVPLVFISVKSSDYSYWFLLAVRSQHLSL